MNGLKTCPFCGGEIVVRSGVVTDILMFCCTKCEAVISFDNDDCNKTPIRAVGYFNRRNKNNET